MTGLFDEIRADSEARKTNKGPRCGMSVLLDQLDEEDRRAVLVHLADPNVLSIAIGEALRKRHYKISDRVINRHRNGGCKCR